jgi:hypothetical protein
MAHSGKLRLRGAAEPLSDWSRCWALFEDYKTLLGYSLAAMIGKI